MAITAALAIGLSKSGFAGVGMLSIALMASLMRGHERDSTGVILPLLVCGDLFAVQAFRWQARWPLILRLLSPTLLGVGLGWVLMWRLSNAGAKPVVGWIVLGLLAIELWRQQRADTFRSFQHTRRFAWTTGIAAGVTTMIANAAGPIMTLYLLAIEVPKLELVGTTAWFFLIVNLCKVPLSTNLGLINQGSLCFNAALAPFVGLGIVGGRFLLHRIPQKTFERLLLVLTVLTALHLIFC